MIHCFAGKSRAAAFTLAYLLKYQKINLKDAVELVKSKRPVAAPNIGFMKQLKKYEFEIFGSNSECKID